MWGGSITREALLRSITLFHTLDKVPEQPLNNVDVSEVDSTYYRSRTAGNIRTLTAGRRPAPPACATRQGAVSVSAGTFVTGICCAVVKNLELAPERVVGVPRPSRVTSGVTYGLPSRSPPIHEPKRSTCGKSRGSIPIPVSGGTRAPRHPGGTLYRAPGRSGERAFRRETAWQIPDNTPPRSRRSVAIGGEGNAPQQVPARAYELTWVLPESTPRPPNRTARIRSPKSCPGCVAQDR